MSTKENTIIIRNSLNSESSQRLLIKSEAKNGEARIFQAIGVLIGEVEFIKEEAKNKYTATISLGGNKYKLLPQGSSRRGQAAFIGLRREIEATGVSHQKLIVYPQITHYPGRGEAHKLAFQLVGFEKEKDINKHVISKELNDLEFKLSGLWQFIPVCSVPCITIMKNYSEERLAFIQTAELALKVSFMKPIHIPLLWKDSPVNPFRFNPKLEKEQQGNRFFVSIKARFIPSRNMFGFDSMLAPPGEPPKFLKASKKDKETALKKKIAARKNSQKVDPENVPSAIQQNRQSTVGKPKLKSKPGTK